MKKTVAPALAAALAVPIGAWAGPVSSAVRHSSASPVAPRPLHLGVSGDPLALDAGATPERFPDLITPSGPAGHTLVASRESLETALTMELERQLDLGGFPSSPPLAVASSDPGGSSAHSEPRDGAAAQPAGEGDGAPRLAQLQDAAAGKIPAERLYDSSGRRLPTAEPGDRTAVFHTFYADPAYHPGGKPQTAPPVAEAPAEAPLAAPAPLRAAPMAEIIDALLAYQKLDADQRAALASIVGRAQAARDVALLANLTFLSLHDSRSKGLMTDALRAMPLIPGTREILAQETRSSFAPFDGDARAQMARSLRAAAPRYADGEGAILHADAK